MEREGIERMSKTRRMARAGEKWIKNGNEEMEKEN